MPFTVSIQITSVGGDAGPFDIYADTIDGLVLLPGGDNVPINLLLAPAIFNITVPDGTFGIVIKSDNVLCKNSVTHTLDQQCYCYEVSSLNATNEIKYKNCLDEIVTETYTNARKSICAKFGTITRTAISGSVATVIGPSTECASDQDCYEEFIMYAVGINQANVRIVTSSCPFVIDYGDGTVVYYNAGSYTIATHFYSTPFTGEVRILSTDLGCISVLRTDNGAPPASPPRTGTLTIIGTELIKLTGLTYLNNITTVLNADVSQLPSTLLRLRSYAGILTGNITTTPLPSGLLLLQLYDSNTLQGDINSLPSGLQIIAIYGQNKLSGSMTTFGAGHTALVNFDLYVDNFVSGSISGLVPITGLLTFRVWGKNTLVGNISNFPSGIQNVTVLGYNSLSGNLSGITSRTSLVVFQVDNPPGTPVIYGNTINGDISSLPNSIVYFVINGKNTVDGDIVDIPSGCTTFILGGNNTLYGDIADMPTAMEVFRSLSAGTYPSGNINTLPSTLKAIGISGINTITGNMGQIPAGPLSGFEITGLNTITGYSGRTWISPMAQMVVASTISFNDPLSPYNDLDDFLIALSGYTWVSNPLDPPQIKLKGARTAASNTAVSTLTGAGVAVTIVP